MFWTDVIIFLTFHEQPMNISPLPRGVSKVIFGLFRYVHSQSHLVQGPEILSSDALQHGYGEKSSRLHIKSSRSHVLENICLLCLLTSEERLWVEETREPNNCRMHQVLSPAVQLPTA